MAKSIFFFPPSPLPPPPFLSPIDHTLGKIGKKNLSPTFLCFEYPIREELLSVRLPKIRLHCRLSLSPTTVLFRTTLTRTITLHDREQKYFNHVHLKRFQLGPDKSNLMYINVYCTQGCSAIQTDFSAQSLVPLMPLLWAYRPGFHPDLPEALAHGLQVVIPTFLCTTLQGFVSIKRNRPSIIPCMVILSELQNFSCSVVTR